VNDAAGGGLGPYVYGLPGILIAHAFFNMPFAARSFDRALAGVAPEGWRLAAQLGMPPGAVFRLIEWPAMARVFLPTAAIVFALCFTSFAVVAVLGGGPAATILEVAIYQALRFEFDIGRAVGLALIQLVLAAALTGPLLMLARSRPEGSSIRRPGERPDVQGPGALWHDLGGIGLFVVVVGLPMLGIVVPTLGALSPERLGAPELWRAAAWSLVISVTAGTLGFGLGLGLAVTMRELWPRAGRRRAAAALEGAGAVILIAPPLLIGAGLFLALRDRVDLIGAAPLLVVAVNVLSGLPFVTRLLAPELARAAERDDRLAASLGVEGLARWRLVDWPAIRGPAATALAIAIAMSAGDLGVIALFGSPETATLPLLIYQRMGAYRMDDAAVGILVLIALLLLVFVAAEALVGRRGRAGA
jgi:thiamine transport system permease protein